MIEPTESESLDTLDAFAKCMIEIDKDIDQNPNKILDAPMTTPVRRLNETKANREIDVNYFLTIDEKMNHIAQDNKIMLRIDKGEYINKTILDVASFYNLKFGWINGLGAIMDPELGYYDLKNKEYIKNNNWRI